VNISLYNLINKISIKKHEVLVKIVIICFFGPLRDYFGIVPLAVNHSSGVKLLNNLIFKINI